MTSPSWVKNAAPMTFSPDCRRGISSFVSSIMIGTYLDYSKLSAHRSLPLPFLTGLRR